MRKPGHYWVMRGAFEAWQVASWRTRKLVNGDPDGWWKLLDTEGPLEDYDLEEIDENIIER